MTSNSSTVPSDLGKPFFCTRAVVTCLVGLMLVGIPGCDSKDKAKNEPKVSSASNKPASEGDAATPSKAKAKAKAQTKQKPTKDVDKAGCCKYCLDDTTPCGDKCLGKGETCTGPAPDDACACAQDKRPTPKFKKGARALQGIIAADVAAFNKAQGDPISGDFTLELAFDGDKKLLDREGGELRATIDTDMGEISCVLFEDKAPMTVANFVGLARGTRPFFDKKNDEWVSGKKYLTDVIFHRVIKGFMLQTGDRSGSGVGGPGYFIKDEFHADLKHDTAGLLSMANRNRMDRRTGKPMIDKRTGQRIGNTGSSQFFVTVAPTPHLDDRHTIFGKCDVKVAKAISKVDTITNRAMGMDHKPKKDVRIRTVKIERKKK